MMKQSIMFVDDEANILNSLVRLFRNQDYEIFTASSGPEALKILEDNDIALVISDHRMPDMSGVEFLSKVLEQSPDTIRIMLTGYADLQASIDAINKGEVYRFIPKPWNDEELRLTVKQSLEYRNLTLDNRNLTRTVKKQYQILKNLEKHHPGISQTSRTEDGSILVDDDDWDEIELDELMKDKDLS